MLAKKVYKQTCQELAKTYKMPVKESTLSVLAVINDIVITYSVSFNNCPRSGTESQVKDVLERSPR